MWLRDMNQISDLTSCKRSPQGALSNNIRYTQMETQNTGELVTFRKLKTIFGINYTKVHLNRLWTAGTFPKPIKFGGAGSRCFWRAADVRAWIEARRPK